MFFFPTILKYWNRKLFERKHLSETRRAPNDFTYSTDAGTYFEMKSSQMCQFIRQMTIKLGCTVYLYSVRNTDLSVNLDLTQLRRLHTTQTSSITYEFWQHPWYLLTRTFDAVTRHKTIFLIFWVSQRKQRLKSKSPHVNVINIWILRDQERVFRLSYVKRLLPVIEEFLVDL